MQSVVIYQPITFTVDTSSSNLLFRDGDSSCVDLFLDLTRVLAVDSASNGEGGTEDLLDGATELLGHGLEPQGAGNVDDGIKGDVTRVLDVLHLLSVSGGLLELLHDHGRGSRDKGGGSLHPRSSPR